MCCNNIILNLRISLFCFLFSGNFELAVDADVLFHKSAFVVIKLCYVKGSVVMKFTKEPFSHWSFSFKPVSCHYVRIHMYIIKSLKLSIITFTLYVIIGITYYYHIIISIIITL